MTLDTLVKRAQAHRMELVEEYQNEMRQLSLDAEEFLALVSAEVDDHLVELSAIPEVKIDQSIELKESKDLLDDLDLDDLELDSDASDIIESSFFRTAQPYFAQIMIAIVIMCVALYWAIH